MKKKKDKLHTLPVAQALVGIVIGNHILKKIKKGVKK